MYIVQEIQTSNGESTLLSPITKADYNQALSVFHEKAMYAAISNVEIHTIIIFDEWGNTCEKVNFTHFLPEPEPDEEIGG